jgi:predicted TIM-barrel fold metal-dependent hydrolase
MNQYEEFFDLLDKYPNLYLDTTMTLGAFFQSLNSPISTISTSCPTTTTTPTTTADLKPMAHMLRTMLLRHSDRILYGTDWPNIPYDWCRELANLVSLVDGDGEATAVVGEGSSESGENVVGKEGRGESRARTKETDEALEKILWRNASRFYRISEQDLGLVPLAPNL